MINRASIPFYILILVYCGGLYWLSEQPGSKVPELPFPSADKLLHAGVYGGLALLGSLALRKAKPPLSIATQFVAPLIFASLYGVSDEFHQRFVPGRFFEFSDMLANATGAAVIQLFVHFGPRRNGKGGRGKPRRTMPS